MTSTPPSTRFFHIDRLDLRFKPRPWPFAQERRAEIDAFFAEQVRQKPSMWNGRVLLLYHRALEGGVFRGECLETDYASFAAWGHWRWPVRDVWDCFGAAAIVSADNAILLGEMGAHTFNGGAIYLPSGTPDLGDIHDGIVDLEFSVRRELKEETGLDIAEFDEEPGWTVAEHGALLAMIKILRSRQSADELRARILAFNATQKEPELTDIRIVRSEADFEPAMRDFVKAFVAHRFAKR